MCQHLQPISHHTITAGHVGHDLKECLLSGQLLCLDTAAHKVAVESEPFEPWTVDRLALKLAADTLAPGPAEQLAPEQPLPHLCSVVH